MSTAIVRELRSAVADMCCCNVKRRSKRIVGGSDSVMHVCSLRKGSESHLPRLPPNARCTARFKRRLQKILLVSARHPFTRFYLRSRAAIAFEKRRHGVSAYWWIVHPCSCFRHYVGRRLFFVDLVSSIPYTWFYREQLQKPKEKLKLQLLFFELLPLLKLFRLSTLRHYIKEIVMKAEGYLFKIKLYKKPTWFIYLTSLHMAGGNLCSYSYTEFKYTDLPDKLIRCLMLLFGMSYFLYVIVITLQFVKSAAEPELKYQSIMHGVKDYINNKKLPRNLKEKLFHFYEHRFQGSLFKEKAITSTLSKHLKHEITQHNSRIILESCPLLNNIPRPLLNSIIGALKQVIFLQDDIIYKYDSEGKCMYFIITGTVAIISYSGKEICHLYDGDYFGELALMQHNRKRTTTAIALEVCEVLRFNRRDFNRLIVSKSEIHNRLELVVQRRMQNIRNIEGEM